MLTISYINLIYIFLQKTLEHGINNICCNLLLKHNIPETLNQRKKLFNSIVKEVATQLHHTPICLQKKYLDMNLYNLYLENPNEFYKFSKKNIVT